MIRIELDRIHLELLLLAGLFATFSGAVFQPIMQNGMNMTPLVAFSGVGIVGLGVLVHRRLSSGHADSRSRIRAMVWFSLLGAVLGAAISSAVVETPRSMMLAAAGVGAMFSAFGTQFSIVIKSREEAAKEAVESILDEKNVFVTPEQMRSSEADEATRTHEANNGSTARDLGDTSTVAESTSESESDVADGVDETTDAADSKTDADDPTTDEQERGTIDQTDDPGSKSWKRSADNTPIPVIRSIEPKEYPED